MYIEKGGDANLVNFANLNAEQNDEWSKDARLATKRTRSISVFRRLSLDFPPEATTRRENHKYKIKIGK